MAAFGPFEPAPRLAVGVSGGGDSMALLRLASAWTAARGGDVLALTVDHGLRADAGAEARRVAERCRRLGIAHEILARDGPKPTGNVQAAARDARYRLLDDACRRHGRLHLLVAHHREDQAETMLLRLSRGSGLRGLAAIPPVRHLAAARVIRPLLTVSRASLTATLRDRGESWIEDPSNADPAYARVALRQGLAQVTGGAVLQRRLAETAGRLSDHLGVVDEALVALLVDAASVSPHGFVLIDRARIAAARGALRLAALGRAVRVVGGGDHPPRMASLARLVAALGGDGTVRARTLGGCRILADPSRILICREAAAAAPAVALEHARAVTWDRRFRVSAAGLPPGTRLAAGALGPRGWRPLEADNPAEAVERAALSVPRPARATLPALYDGEGLLGIPGLDLWRAGAQDIGCGVSVRFAPRHALGPPVAAPAPYSAAGTRNLRL